MLTYSFFCYCTSTEGPVSQQVRKMCPILDAPLIGVNMIIFVKEHVSRAHIRKCTLTITKYYITNVLVNIWNQGRNLQNLSSQNPF